MRITGVHIDAFGCFRDVDFNGLGAAVVCISGPNEVGKSTLVHFFESMLYGLYPADAERNPFAPRDGRYLQGRLRYQLSDGSGGEIQRGLRSGPSGEWTDGDGLFSHPKTIRNRTLPPVSHVSRRVFRNVFALGLSDMTELGGATFDEIQDQLLGGLNATHLRTARTVGEGIAEEAKRLWRPTRHRTTRVMSLSAERKDLAEAVRSARERAERIRFLSQALRDVEQEIEQLTDKRLLGVRQLEELRATATLADQIEELDNLRNVARGVDSLADVSDDPAAELSSLRAQARALRHEFASIRASHDRLVEEIQGSPDPKAVLSDLDKIRTAIAGMEGVQSTTVEYESTRRRLVTLRSRLDAPAASLEQIRSVSQVDPRSVGAIADLIHEGGVEADRVSTAYAEGRAQVRRYMFVAAFVATVAVVVGLVLEPRIAVVAGVLSAVALGLSVHRQLRQRSLRQRLEELEDDQSALEQRFADEAVDISSLTRERVRATRTGVLVVNELVTLAQDYLECADIVDTMEQRYARAESSLREIAARVYAYPVSLDVVGAASVDPNADVTELIQTLERVVAHCHDAARVNDEALASQRDLVVRLDGIEAALQDVIKTEEHLSTRLAAFGDGDLRNGLDRLATAREARRQAQILESALKDRDLGGLAADGTKPASARAELRLEVESIESRLDRAREEAVGYREELAGLRVHPSLSDVESDLHTVEAEIDRARTRHDELRFLEAVVKRADARFRDRHQPDVIARTNEYLTAITDGRYRGVAVDETTGELVVFGAGYPQPMPVKSAVSRGTRDQVYLSLRLALADHMDEGRERLPIVLDEVFVTWDEGRRQSAYPILADLSQRRQVIVTTCHKWFEEEVMVHLDAKVVHVVDGVERARAGEVG